MRKLRCLLAISLLCAMTSPAQTAVSAQSSPLPDEALSSELNIVVLDLMTGFSNTLAARDRRYAIQSQRFSRLVADLRAEQRRLASGNLAARARIFELERELTNLSWVTEPRFRDVMIAYRNLITRALQAASPRALEGWQLLASGHPAAGLEILRENERLAEQADRDAAAQMHVAVDRVAREATADRRRLIAIEALKSVISRQLRADIAIADWLNIVETGESNRGDHLILSYLYYLDGNESESASQRSISATRPAPPARISTLLDDLFGAPTTIVLDVLAVGPDEPDRFTALQAPTEQLIAQRADLSPRDRRELVELYSGMANCLSSISQSEEAETPASGDISDPCVTLLARAASISTRLASRASSPRRSPPFGPGLNVARAPADPVEASALFADLTALLLIALWTEGDAATGEPDAGAGAVVAVPEPTVAQRPRWEALAAALRTMTGICAHPVANIGLTMPGSCARIRLYSVLIRRATGEAVSLPAMAAAVTGLVDIIGRRSSDSGPVVQQMNEVHAVLAWLDRMSADLVVGIDSHEGLRIASALLETTLTAPRGEFPHALDDAILLNGIAWYEEFVRNHGSGDSRRAHATAELNEIFLRILSNRPAFAPSCHSLLQFADGILASPQPLDATDLRILEGLLEPARACGLAPPSPLSMTFPSGDRPTGQVPFRDILRLLFSFSVLDRLERDDVATARALANMVAFGRSAAPTGAVFEDRDYNSFSAYNFLAFHLERRGLIAEAAAAYALLFASGQIIADEDLAYRPCGDCPPPHWRFDVGLSGTMLARTRLQTGDESGAAEAYRRVIALGSRAGESLGVAYFGHGLISLRRGDVERGLADLRASVALARQDRQSRSGQSDINARLDAIQRNYGFGDYEARLGALTRALTAAGRVEEAGLFYAELLASLYQTMDGGESRVGVTFALIEAGTEYCALQRRVVGQRAGRACRIELGYQIARRHERPGADMALRSVAARLREDLRSRRNSRDACVAIARLADAGAKARLMTELGLVCP